MSRPDRAVFRLPGISLLLPLLLFICVTPLANAGADFWLVLYLLPVLGLAYILTTRTMADPELIKTTGLFGVHRLAWSDLDGFEFRGPRWAVAVALDGRRVRLPMVRPRDLPRLASVSGGRLLLGKDAPVAEQAEPEEPGTRGEPDAQGKTTQQGVPDEPGARGETTQQVETTPAVDVPVGSTPSVDTTESSHHE